MMVTYEQLGHNMWKCSSASKEGDWHYISRHKCPFLEYEDAESKEDDLEDFEEYHYICSCRSYTIGIPAKNDNPLEIPCKHVLGLWDKLET